MKIGLHSVKSLDGSVAAAGYQLDFRLLFETVFVGAAPSAERRRDLEDSRLEAEEMLCRFVEDPRRRWWKLPMLVRRPLGKFVIAECFEVADAHLFVAGARQHVGDGDPFD